MVKFSDTGTARGAVGIRCVCRVRLHDRGRLNEDHFGGKLIVVLSYFNELVGVKNLNVKEDVFYVTSTLNKSN